MSAAQSALANLSLQTGDLDDAIRRFEELKRSSETGTLSRGDRWQLITAYVAKGQWPVAKREMAAILNDTKNPPTDDERVRGRQLLPAAQGRSAAAGPARLRAARSTRPTRGGRHPGVHPPEGEEVSTRRPAPPQGDRADGPGAGEAAGRLLPDARGGRERDAARATATKRAVAVLDQGLAVQPNSIELVQAKYLLLTSTGDPRAPWRSSRPRPRTTPRAPSAGCWSTSTRAEGVREGRASSCASSCRSRPTTSNLAAALVQVVSLEAAEAAAAGQGRAAAVARREGASHDPRVPQRYPDEPDLPPGRMRPGGPRRRLTRAIAITQEIDKVAKTSTMGPLLRARLYRPAGQDARGGQGLRRGARARTHASPTSASCSARTAQARRARRGARAGQARARRRQGSARRHAARGPVPSPIGSLDVGEEAARAGGRRAPRGGDRRGSPAFVEPITSWPRSS